MYVLLAIGYGGILLLTNCRLINFSCNSAPCVSDVRLFMAVRRISEFCLVR